MRSPVVSPVLRAILTNSTLLELGPSSASLSLPSRFAAGARRHSAEIAALFTRELGRTIAITIVDEADRAPGAAAVPAAVDPAASSGAPAPAIAAPGPPPQAGADGAAGPAGDPIDDPLVKTALELFSARIVSVQPRQPS